MDSDEYCSKTSKRNETGNRDSPWQKRNATARNPTPNFQLWPPTINTHSNLYKHLNNMFRPDYECFLVTFHSLTRALDTFLIPMSSNESNFANVSYGDIETIIRSGYELRSLCFLWLGTVVRAEACHREVSARLGEFTCISSFLLRPSCSSRRGERSAHGLKSLQTALLSSFAILPLVIVMPVQEFRYT
jgi:hypothetical protein